MVEKTSIALNIQTLMIVWDVNLRITNKVDKIDIFTPLFSLNPNNRENSKWIRLLITGGKLYIASNFSSIREFKE